MVSARLSIQPVLAQERIERGSCIRVVFNPDIQVTNVQCQEHSPCTGRGIDLDPHSHTLGSYGRPDVIQLPRLSQNSPNSLNSLNSLDSLDSPGSLNSPDCQDSLDSSWNRFRSRSIQDSRSAAAFSSSSLFISPRRSASKKARVLMLYASFS